MKQEYRAQLEAAQIDVEKALERFGGNEALYLKFLTKFLQDENFVQMMRCVSGRDYDGALQHAHALKGVTGNLGLDVLYQGLQDVVSDLRGNRTDGLEQKTTQLHAHYSSTCATIEKVAIAQ